MSGASSSVKLRNCSRSNATVEVGCTPSLSDAEHRQPIGRTTQWRDNLENAVHALLEILHRFEVKEIEAMERVDLALHKVISYEPAEFAEDDGRILMRVKRGFVWRGKLIRPEEVIAKRFG